jgi:hypothetical protein
MIQFSAQTRAARVQQALAQKLVKKGRDVLAAPRGKKVKIENFKTRIVVAEHMT